MSGFDRISDARAPLGVPYEGAKTHYILDIDDSALLDAVVPVLERETPVRRKKSK